MISVVGDFLQDIDRHFRTVRKSPEGDWPIVVEDAHVMRPGGAGAVVEMVRALGEECHDVGTSCKQLCRKERFFLDGRQVFRNDIDHTEPISNLLAQAIMDCISPRTKLILVADYAKGSISDRLWELLLSLEKPLIVDPSRHRPLDWYVGATAIIPNRHEAGVTTLFEAYDKTKELRRLFPKVCIKLDRDGMVSSGDGELLHMPAAFDTVVDVTGAGDMVLAAIGVGLLRGMNWISACLFANELAGRKCQQQGATPVFLKTA